MSDAEGVGAVDFLAQKLVLYPAFDDGGITLVLFINVFLFLFGFLFWNFCLRARRQSNVPLFDDENAEDDVSSSQQKNEEPVLDFTRDMSSFSWIGKLIRFSDEDVIEKAGIDASIYLRLLKKLILFFAVLSLLGIILLVPVNIGGGGFRFERTNNTLPNIPTNSSSNLTSSTQLPLTTNNSSKVIRSLSNQEPPDSTNQTKPHYGFTSTTIANIEDGDPILWLHFGFTCIVSGLFYWLLLWLSVTYQKNSRHPDRVDVRSFTVMIDNFPRNLGGPSDEAQLRDYFEQFYSDQVLQVYIVVDVEIFNEIYTQQRKLAKYERKLHHYQAVLAQTRHRPTIEEGFGRRLITRLRLTSNSNNSPTDLSSLGPKKGSQKSSNKVPFNPYESVKIDAIEYYLSKIKRSQQIIARLKNRLQFQGAPNTSSGSSLYDDQPDDFMSPSSPSPHKKLTKGEEERGAGLAFVTFKSTKCARRCIHDFATSEPPPPPRHISQIGTRGASSQGNLLDEHEARKGYHSLNVHQWCVTKAPHPEDIRWKALGVSRWEFWIRSLTINSILLVILFFFTTPLAVVGGLQSFLLLTLSNQMQNEDEADWKSILSSSWFESIVTGFIPSILLLAVTAFIPLILEKISEWEGHRTVSMLDRSIMRKVSVFLLISALILPSVALTSVDALVEFLIKHSPVRLFERLGGVNPNFAFFVNYIIQASFLGGLISLLRPGEYILMKWRKRTAITELERKEAIGQRYPFSWGYNYSLCLLIFSMGIFFSTFVPLVLPTAMIYFMIRFFVDKYNLLVVHVHTRSDFHIMKIIRKLMMLSCCLYQLCVFVYFLFVKNSFYVGLASLLLFLCSVVYVILDFVGTFKSLSRKEKEEWTEVEDDIYKGPGGEVWLQAFRDAYLHPGMKSF